MAQTTRSTQSATQFAADASDCFALLDDCDASGAEPRSRLYTGYLGTLCCQQAADLPRMLESMQDALDAGQHALGLFTYELGPELLATAPRALYTLKPPPGEANDQNSPPRQPLAQILMFSDCRHLAATEVEAWLIAQCVTVAVEATAPAGISAVHANITEAQFDAALARIHAYIEAGDTYQVNYTYRLRFDTFGSPHALYLRLRSRQPVPYGALIKLPDGSAILSLSPELFVRHAHGLLTARPMKGTARASGEPETDALRAQALASDPKNRAENLMIVDLLRNDLGRIAQPGSVQVPRLFEVQRYSSVLQMTSTVQARLRDDVTLADIFSALFPCGSITGAPKHRTMQIIDELEPEPRGYYTGAIAWFSKPDGKNDAASDRVRRIGDFCMSVPIRTLLLQPPAANGVRRGELGVGAGIVHDSATADEFAECRLKAGFLTGLRNDFVLFETMQASRDAGCRHLERHLQRLRSSALYFGFMWDEANVRDLLQQACATLSPDGLHRMRLTLDQAGLCRVRSAPLTPLQAPVRVLLAPQPTLASDLFLRHKSSVRTRYDEAWLAAEANGAFDMLFFNTAGELTEGGRCNVFLQLGGRWYTPPLAAGVLPGVMRAVLLNDPGLAACERRLTLDDVRAAGKIMVCNALRGAIEAFLGDG